MLISQTVRKDTTSAHERAYYIDFFNFKDNYSIAAGLRHTDMSISNLSDHHKTTSKLYAGFSTTRQQAQYFSACMTQAHTSAISQLLTNYHCLKQGRESRQHNGFEITQKSLPHCMKIASTIFTNEQACVDWPFSDTINRPFFLCHHASSFVITHVTSPFTPASKVSRQFFAILDLNCIPSLGMGWAF